MYGGGVRGVMLEVGAEVLALVGDGEGWGFEGVVLVAEGSDPVPWTVRGL